MSEAITKVQEDQQQAIPTQNQTQEIQNSQRKDIIQFKQQSPAVMQNSQKLEQLKLQYSFKPETKASPLKQQNKKVSRYQESFKVSVSKEEKNDLSKINKEIKEIAGYIRSKVKKSPFEIHNQASKSLNLKKNNVPSSFFLTPIRPLTPLYSRIKKDQQIQQQEDNEFADNQQDSEQAKLKLQKQKYKMINKMIKKLILKKVDGQIQKSQKKIKMNFDNSKHHYPLNSFRKKIFIEKKEKIEFQNQKRTLQQQLLKKRRHFLSQSRYHPKGIKGSTHLSKVVTNTHKQSNNTQQSLNSGLINNISEIANIEVENQSRITSEKDSKMINPEKQSFQDKTQKEDENMEQQEKDIEFQEQQKEENNILIEAQ